MGQALLYTKGPSEDDKIKSVIGKDFRSLKTQSFYHLPQKLMDIISLHPEVLIFDLEVPGCDGLQLVRRLRKAGSSIPVLIVSGKSDLGRLRGIEALGPLEYVTKPFYAPDFTNRLRKLLRSWEKDSASPPSLSDEISEALLGHVVKELHDSKTGRLDSVKVAKFLGIPLAAMAKAMGKEVKAVYKTPAAESLQQWLIPLEGTIAALVRLFGEKELVRAWLNSAHPRLGNRTPIELIRQGDIREVAGLVYDVAEGNFS